MTRLACIIPTHNMAATLGRALDSACNQTFDRIVVVDDASTDDTPVVVEQYASRFPQVEYVRHMEKAACHLTALRPICDALDVDHIVGLAADDMLLPALATAVRENANHAVIFSNYSCERAGYTWCVRHPFADSTCLGPQEMRARVQAQEPAETGIGSSIRSDVLRWLWEHNWTELGPHADSIGYATVACVFGACYVPVTGAHVSFNPDGYGQRQAANDPHCWAAVAADFMRRASLDDATIQALVRRRCYGFNDGTS